MPAGSIILDLLLKTGTFETDTKRAEKALAELKKEARDMGVAVGAAFAAVGVASVALVKHSIDVADETVKMAQKVGTSVEALSALAYAADLSGLSHEQLGAAMVKLSHNMSDAANGTGDAAKAFDALGISVKNSDGTLKASDQVLGEIAGKFAGYKDGVEKTALAVAVFGRAGADLIPLLNSGSEGLEKLRTEAQELGVVLDTEAAKAAEAFNDNLSRMSAAISGVANKAAAELLPALNDVSEMFLGVAKNEATVEVATGVVKAAVGALINVFQTVAVVGSDVGFVFLSVGREIGAWAAQINALAHGDLQGFHAISDMVKADGERARAELDKFQARIMSIGAASDRPGQDAETRRLLGRGMTPPLVTAPRIAGPAGPKGPKGPDPDADFKSYLNNLQQQVQKTHDLGVEEKLLDDIRRGHLTVSEDQKGRLITLAKEIDATKEAQRIAEERAAQRRKDDEASLEAAREIERADRDRLRALLDAGPAAQLEKQRKEMEYLAAAFERGAITAEQFNDAATGYLHLTADATKETKSVAEELGMTFESAFENAIVGGESMSAVFRGLLQDISRVILRLMVIEPLVKQLKSAMEGAGMGSGFNFGKAILSGFGGGGLQASFAGTALGSSGFGSGLAYGNMDLGGFFADGGVPPVGKPVVVGERGPELFIPRTAGMVVPNNQLGSGGGHTTIVNQTTGRVDNVVEQRISPRERVLFLQEARAAIAADIHNASSPVSKALRQSYSGLQRNR